MTGMDGLQNHGCYIGKFGFVCHGYVEYDC